MKICFPASSKTLKRKAFPLPYDRLIFMQKTLKRYLFYKICTSLRHSRIRRSSRPDVFCEKVVLRNFAKFTGKHLCQSLSFNKVAGLKPATLLKERPWHRCFPMNFAKFLTTPLFTEHLWWLLLFVFLRVVGNQGYASRKGIHWKIFEQIGIGKTYLHVFLMTMREIDRAAEVHLEPF